MIRCAARAMDCNPELQKAVDAQTPPCSLEVRRAGQSRARTLPPVVPSPNVEPMITSLDFGRVDAGALHRVPHRMRAERGAISHVEGTFPTLAEAGTRRRYDDRFCHLGCSL